MLGDYKSEMLAASSPEHGVAYDAELLIFF